ncbi:MAG: sugar phosphate isomerase/epimerase family protein [Candidatus Bathyarchaeia archaeon]
MRLGISTWVYFSHPVDEAVLRLARRGFRVLELWADQSQLDPRLFPEAELSRVRELGARLGLTFYSFHAPFSGLDLASPKEEKREESVRVVVKASEYAAKLGCRFTVVHPGSSESMTVTGDAAEAEARGRLLEALSRLGEGAERHGVKVLLENMTERNGRRYGSRIKDLRETVKALGRGGFGLSLDPGHTVLSRLGVYDELRETEGLLMSLHANDNDGLKDLHLVPMKTEASIDWRRFLGVLEETGYSGPFMLEVYGGDTPDQVVEDARALCEKLPGLQL